MANSRIVTLSKEVYPIPVPKSFSIGDPDLLNIVWAPEVINKTREKKMVFEREKIPKTWKATLIFTKELWDMKYPVMAARLCVSHRDYVEIYADGRYFVDAVKRGFPRDLVCEQAAYRILVEHHSPDENGNTVTDYQFRTGADGVYGNAIDMVKRHGFSVRFEFPNWDILPEHQIRDRLAYLFRCPEIMNPPSESEEIE